MAKKEKKDPVEVLEAAQTRDELVAAIQTLTAEERRVCGEAIAAAKKRVK